MKDFPFYGKDVHQTIPTGLMSLSQFIDHIKTPLPKDKTRYEDIRKADLKGDVNLKRKLKEGDWFCCPAVQLKGGRGYRNITAYTGLLVLDFDKMSDIGHAEELKEYLFDEYEEVLCAWRSVSGRGVRALVLIPECQSVDEYKGYFWGFMNQLPKEIKEYADSAPQNPVLPLFMSMDSRIQHREPLMAWTQPGVKRQKVQEYTAPRVNYTETIHGTAEQQRYKTWSINNFEQAIHKITNNAHPQLRAHCVTFGGRVGAGYLERFEAEAIIHRAVSDNTYMSKGTRGYIKTALEMLSYGIDYPLYF